MLVVYIRTHVIVYGVYIWAFTGDTLFIGSCGRPDLIGAIGHSANEMSERMYHSLKNKISTLPDDVKVSILFHWSKTTYRLPYTGFLHAIKFSRIS